MTTTLQRPPRGRLRTLLQGSGFLAVCIVVMNVATYGFQIMAARLLGPDQYGGVASMMALLLVVGVFQLGLQATAARRVSAEPHRGREIERLMLAVTYRASAVVGGVMLVASPLVWHLLKLDSIIPALLVAACAVPLTVMGGQAGILQGERRWLELAAVYLALGLPRVAVGTACIVLRPTEAAAMAGVAAAQVAPAVVGWWVLRRRTSAVCVATRGPLRPAVTETLHSSFALLGFFVLSNVDIVLARNVLTDRQSGLYAGGLILTKAVLFLPQFVVVVAFPSLSTAGERRRSLLVSLAAVGGCGAVSVLGAWLLSPVAMIFIGGSDYTAVQHRLWLFAVLGTVLAVLQLLVYSVLARQHRASAYLIWGAVVLLVAIGVATGSLNALLVTVSAVDAALTVSLLGLSLWHLRDDLPEPALEGAG
ncbi:lipopolysaccharide biosynthesis protein [Nocardioides sp. DS6]|uniref:Lipopolysaccharide biosynthesis protein n=1 Tax=Nocardioides eburneus TaxID=3231482 RepID=A0ABV3SX67_9ACTN